MFLIIIDQQNCRPTYYNTLVISLLYNILFY